jgi:hypothetical protein
MEFRNLSLDKETAGTGELAVNAIFGVVGPIVDDEPVSLAPLE